MELNKLKGVTKNLVLVTIYNMAPNFMLVILLDSILICKLIFYGKLAYQQYICFQD